MVAASLMAHNSAVDDVAKLLLRVVLGLLILFHGTSKPVGGIGPVAGALAKFGIPAGVGYLVFVGEFIAPLLLLIGIWTRIAALLITANMIVAVLLVHTAQFFTLSPTGGWALELQAMYFSTSIVIAMLGAGRYSIGGPNGRFN